MSDGFHPFTEPYLRALRVQSYVEDLKHKREVRELEKEQFKANLEHRKRTSAMQDFITRQILQESGALDVGANDVRGETVLDSALGPVTPQSKRTVMDVPGIGRRWMPSQQDKSARATREALEKGRNEGLIESEKIKATQAAKQQSGASIKVKYPAIGDQPEVEAWIPRERYGEYVKDLRAMKGGKFRDVTIKTDKITGVMTMIGIDEDTGQPFEKVLTTRMSPEDPGTTSSTLTDKDGNVVNVIKDKTTNKVKEVEKVGPYGKPSADTNSSDVPKYKDVLSEVRRVQKAINDARRADAAGKDDSGALWENARSLANAAKQAYPGQINVYGLEQGKYPAIEVNNKGFKKRASNGQVQSAPTQRNYITRQEYENLLRGKDKAAVDAKLRARGVEVR